MMIEIIKHTQTNTNSLININKLLSPIINYKNMNFTCLKYYGSNNNENHIKWRLLTKKN